MQGGGTPPEVCAAGQEDTAWQEDGVPCEAIPKQCGWRISVSQPCAGSDILCSGDMVALSAESEKPSQHSEAAARLPAPTAYC